MQIDLSKMDITQLKAFIYDQVKQVETCKANVEIAERQIVMKTQQEIQKKVKETKQQNLDKAIEEKGSNNQKENDKDKK